MTSAAKHLLVIAPERRTRRRAFRAAGPVEVEVSAHARLRGPYSGVGRVLEAIVPHAEERWPELVDAHRRELLIAAPALEQTIGLGPRSLVDTTPADERTRFFGLQLIRAVSQGIISFLSEYARRDRAGREVPLTFAFDDMQRAEPTTQELIAILLRRADPAVLRLVIGTTGDPLPAELATSLERYAQPVHVDESIPPAQPDRPAAELLRAYIESDGTSDDPAELSAYHAAARAERARLHDERGDQLELHDDRDLRLGAIPYHRERGSDPTGAGRRALRVALEHCVATGYSAATVDFGERGRRVVRRGRPPARLLSLQREDGERAGSSAAGSTRAPRFTMNSAGATRGRRYI